MWFPIPKLVLFTKYSRSAWFFKNNTEITTRLQVIGQQIIRTDKKWRVKHMLPKWCLVVKIRLPVQQTRHKRCEFNPWVGKIPWSRNWQPSPVFSPRKFYGQRNLAGYSPLGHKESDTTESLSTQNILLIIYRYYLPGNEIYFISTQISKVSVYFLKL